MDEINGCHRGMIPLRTSGSTGRPRTIWADPRRMRASARLTCDFLDLREGDTALLCLSTDYIAGKMMEVRAEVRHLQLIRVEPDGHPLRTVTTPVDFAAMVPLQVYNTLQSAEETARLRQIRHLIIGGGAVHPDLESALHDFPHAVWSTYGMTETLSHIALRRINGTERSDWYTAMDGVSVSLDGGNCLVIDAPAVCEQRLTTNDIACINPDNPRQFRIIGRKDNVVCSGGIKIQIEEVERLLSTHLSCPFLLTRQDDVKFGEILILVAQCTDADLPGIRAVCERVLPAFQRPKRYSALSALPQTHSGKPDRRRAAEIIG